MKTKPQFPVIIPKSHGTSNATKSSNAKAWVVKAITEEGKNPPPPGPISSAWCRFVPNSDVACLIGSEAIIQPDANDVELIAKGCVER